MNIFKKFLFLGIIISFLLPNISLADTNSTVPQLNPLCWKKEDCIKIRSTMFGVTPSPTNDANGCIAEAPCNQEGWCKCLPAGKTKASVSIGGKTEFIHLGEYIRVVFNYALVLAGVLAVLVIIVAGLQWLTSGGNKTIIGNAKKRIGGAFIGLFLAYGSFFILSSINPAFTSLRLPQVWMMKPQELMPTFCSEIDDDTTKLAFVANYTDQTATYQTPAAGSYTLTYKEAKADTTSITDPKNKMNQFYCGHRFLAEVGGSTACFGDFCKSSTRNGETYANSCSLNSKQDDPKKYICQEGNLTGKIYYSNPVNQITASCAVKTVVGLEGWTDTPVETIVTLYGICHNPDSKTGKINFYTTGISGEVKPTKISDNNFVYRYSVSNEMLDRIAKACDNVKDDGGQYQGNIKGFALQVGMDEACGLNEVEYHLIGKNGVDLGNSLIGDAPTGLPLYQVAKGIWQLITKSDAGFIGTTDFAKISQSKLISLSDLKKGIILNIDASKIYDIDDNDKADWTKAGYYNN